jgi:Ca2+-binding EF-hand superfamily protein
MKNLYLSVLVLITFLFSGIALAEPKEFKKADVNADGFLDSAEFANSGVDDEFKEFDGNGDGKVSEEEYEEKLQECE